MDTKERTEDERCSVLWFIGLSRFSLSRDAKLKAFRNLETNTVVGLNVISELNQWFPAVNVLTFVHICAGHTSLS